jgi:carbonic anhydrase
MGTLCYGDNLNILKRHIKDESVDLVYISISRSIPSATTISCSNHPSSARGIMKLIKFFPHNAVALLLLFALAGCTTPAPQSTRRDLAALKAEQAALTPVQVLESLRRGNERFAAGKREPRDMLHDQQITAAGQYPHAVILSCIDSRAPAEFIFDAGLGDLFNARIAGNIADADLVGSMEFACAVSGAKLVLVMGHTSCGAIKGACDRVQLGNLTGLLDKIQPAVEAVRDVPGERNSKNKAFVEAVSVANVRLTVAHIRELSPILSDLERAGKIKIAGCVYDLDTGRVQFLQ